VYFLPAGAMARKAELTPDAGQKMSLARRAVRYYEEARRLDWNGALEAKIVKVLAHLEPMTGM
jgi:hypothetical protein